MNKKPLAIATAALIGIACTGAPDAPLPSSQSAGSQEHVGVQRQADVSLPPSIKAISSLASKLGSYYSKAKTVVDVATWLGEALGILDAQDPNKAFDDLKNTVQAAVLAADWHDTIKFIDDQRGPAIWALGRLEQTGGVIAPGGNEDQSSGSSAQTISQGGAFLRTYSEAETDGTPLNWDGRSLWKLVIPDRQTLTAGLAYDWRLGAPALLELTSYRLHMIAAMDSNFRWDRTYDSSDLIPLRTALETHYRQMREGIRCKKDPGSETALSIGWFCADINTGNYLWTNIRPLAPSETDDDIFSRMRSALEQSMPLFEMRSLINTLTLYLSGAPDLTDALILGMPALANQQLRSAQSPELCLDGVGGDASPMNGFTMAPCNGSQSQTWVYDRTSGLISNPYYGTCLDVVNGDAPQVNLVWNFWCNGTNAQLWTYDPSSQMLQNALGTAFTWDRLFGTPIVAAVTAPLDPPGAPWPDGVAKWSSTCSDVCSVQWGPMRDACDSSCAQSVCAADSFCCDSSGSWDFTCVGESTTICGLGC